MNLLKQIYEPTEAFEMVITHLKVWWPIIFMGQSNPVENEQILENEAENVFVLVTRLAPHAFVTKIPNDSAKNAPLQKMVISVV